MPFNEDGSRKTALYKKSGFKMKSGNSPLFKYMGSSPVRTEGHGGEEDHSHEELLTTEELNVGSVGLAEGGTQEDLNVRQRKASEATNKVLKKGESQKSKLESTYPGTTWNKVKTKSNPRGGWMTDDGRLLRDM